MGSGVQQLSSRLLHSRRQQDFGAFTTAAESGQEPDECGACREGLSIRHQQCKQHQGTTTAAAATTSSTREDAGLSQTEAQQFAQGPASEQRTTREAQVWQFGEKQEDQTCHEGWQERAIGQCVAVEVAVDTSKESQSYSRRGRS